MAKRLFEDPGFLSALKRESAFGIQPDNLQGRSFACTREKATLVEYFGQDPRFCEPLLVKTQPLGKIRAVKRRNVMNIGKLRGKSRKTGA